MRRESHIVPYLALLSAMATSGIVHASKAPDLDSMSLEELLSVDLVVTSASKLEQTVDEAPALIAVISRAEIENFGFRTIAEALNGLPGVFVIENLVSPEVAIRGIHGGPESWSRTSKHAPKAIAFNIPTLGELCAD